MTAVRRSRWDRDVKGAVAVLVGLVAVVAAIFGTLEADTSKQAERASVMSARLATQVFEATAVVSQIYARENMNLPFAVRWNTDPDASFGIKITLRPLGR